MYIPQATIKSNLLYMIIQILKANFPELFKENKFRRPRKYSLGKVLALVIYQARSSNLSFRKIVKSLKGDALSLQILGFEDIPNFTVIFKSYSKYLKENMNFYLSTIGSKIYENENTFYLDSSSLITSKLDKEAGVGKSTRLGWYSGYKLHLICNRKGVPLHFKVTTANIHDSRCESLLEFLSKTTKTSVDILADKGYDSSRPLKYSKELGLDLICPLNKRKVKKLELEKIKDPLRRTNYTYLISKEGKYRIVNVWK